MLVVGRRFAAAHSALWHLALPSVAQDIRDDLIEQEIKYRRVDASVRRDVDATLRQLSRDLKDLMIKIDVNGTKRLDARNRRLKKFEKESKILIRTAYSEIGGITRNTLRRVAKVETKNTVAVVGSRLP